MSTREFMAAKLREYRKAKGMSPKEVGKVIGKSDKTISAWEVGRGQPDADMLVTLCQLFSVNISDFYPDIDQQDEEVITKQNEIRLLRAFRALDSDVQEHVLATIEALAK